MGDYNWWRQPVLRRGYRQREQGTEKDQLCAIEKAPKYEHPLTAAQHNENAKKRG